MKKIIITTRVVETGPHKEPRDCLDKRLAAYFENIGYLTFLMPNHQNPDKVSDFIASIKPDAVILSGGNNISPALYFDKNKQVADVSTIRDENETRILDIAVKNPLKILGICRGMQMINVYFKGKLLNVRSQLHSHINHIGATHPINITRSDAKLGLKKADRKIVNSFHEQGFTENEIGKNLLPLAEAEDGIIEAIRHEDLPIVGIQWHPERDKSDSAFDLKLVKGFLEG